jgi:hypothetical protein
MKRAIPIMVLVAGAVWTGSLSAQGRNFAGTWTIDQEKTMNANAASAAAAGGGAGGMRSGGGGGGGAVGTVSGGEVAVARGGGGGGRGGAVGAGEPAAGAVTAAGGGGGFAGAGGARGRGGAPAPVVISIDANTFNVGNGETSTAFKLDGSATTIPTANGDATAKASWKGDKLVVETTAQGPNGPIVSTATWYLDGESLVRENVLPAPNGQTITRKTYFKKAS